MLPAEQRTIDEYYVIEALLQHNYLPAQKGFGEELPPIFNSTDFSLPAAEALSDISLRRNGYDSLKYGTTRPNQTARALSIPHPLPYAHLVLQLASNWDEIRHITHNERSHIKPSRDESGRILTMNYHDQPLEQLERELDASLGKNFRVQADIRQCFSSMPVNLFSLIESELEVLTVDGSKPNYRNRWFHKLERSLALANRNQPTGLAIGSASSNIVAEYLLFHVDDELQRKGFHFNRYIDDYICYCESHEEAKAFLSELRGLLECYHLELNASKTKISELPQPLSPGWLIDLQASLPVMKYDEHNYSLTEALRYLDYALRLQQQTPGQNVLKFAVKSILNNLGEWERERVYHYVLNLSRQHPSLLPLLIDLPQYIHEFSQPARIHELLKIIVRDSAKQRRSDGMVWGLYYLFKLNAELDESLIAAVQRTRDPMALVCLQAYHVGTEGTLSLLLQLQSEGDLWAIDRYWMLFYQFYLEGILPNPYPQDNVFEILRYYGIGFINLDDAKAGEG